MSKHKKNTMSRRDFVATSAVAVAAAGCFSIGAKEALAFARATGTIPLTSENLNRLFEEQYKAGRIRTVAKEISGDIAGWLENKCALTAVQQRRIKSITPDQWAEVRKVLQVVAEKGSRLTVQISDPEGVFRHHAMLTCRGTVKTETTNPNGSTSTTTANVDIKT